MTMSESRVGRKLSLAVVSIDVACCAAFGLIGLHSHTEALTIANFSRAFVPFAASWLLVAFTLGLLAKPDAAAGSEMFQRAAAGWTLAWFVGFLARMLLFGRPFVLAFALVSFLTVGILLISWRTAFALVSARRRARIAPHAFA